MPLAVYYVVSATIMSFVNLFRWIDKVFIVIVGVRDMLVPSALDTSCLGEHCDGMPYLDSDWFFFVSREQIF